MTCDKHDWQPMAGDPERPKMFMPERCSKCTATRFLYGEGYPEMMLTHAFDMWGRALNEEKDET